MIAMIWPKKIDSIEFMIRIFYSIDWISPVLRRECHQYETVTYRIAEPLCVAAIEMEEF